MKNMHIVDIWQLGSDQVPPDKKNTNYAWQRLWSVNKFSFKGNLKGLSCVFMDRTRVF